MKKIILSLAVVAALGFTSCSSDDDNNNGDNCATLLQNAENAADAYFEDFESVEKCNALKAALQAAINGECGTAEELAEAQTTLEFLTCEE